MLKADPRTWFTFYQQSLNFSCLDRLKELRLPLLLIYGSRDFINQHIRAYKKNVPNYQSVIIQGVSHQVPVKKWKEINRAVVDFLEERVIAE
ncbi:MAG TPA: hypothetical protein DCR24_06535 [Bacillus bacterium]|nr:hypothetical protein [Bacillus sp. (in: firmicutes)]